MVSKINISESGLELSELALGMWRIHMLATDQLDQLLNTALDNGITTFDHADIYGSYTCEAVFGHWMKANKDKRSEIQLVSKCGIKLLSENRPEHRIKHYDTSKKHIIQSVENSLEQLNTDYLDLLLIHRPDPLMNVFEMADAYASLKQSGKVNYFGVSNFTNHQFDLLASACDMPLVTNQIEVSLFQHQPLFDGTLDHLNKLKINPMVWSPLGGSKHISDAIAKKDLQNLANKYSVSVGDLVLIWLLQHPAGIVPVIGTMNPERVQSAASNYQTTLEREDWFEMLRIANGNDVA
ncbi:MAG: aldo/keto reductase [Fulvivirga sp.]|uniref:aldo/keto reductase n=1 Tax=Fulvivirga sp. TaxID=1931237 RepID=UPI0032EAB592